jgi:iron complex transport system permease protein
MSFSTAVPTSAVTNSFRAAGDRSQRAQIVLVLLCVALVFTAAFGVSSGASDASAFAVLKDWLLQGTGADAVLTERDRIIIYDIRLPRVAMGIMVGAGLAVSGAVMQGLFRNPLADPGIVGVSAGASLGAVSVIVLGTTVLAPVTALLGIYALPLAAFVGSLAVTMVLYKVATRRGQTSIATMLLAGIALGAMATALTGLLIFVADDRQLRDLTFWSLGSLAGATWTKVFAAGSIVAAALAVSPFFARGLNALALGESSAAYLGVPVQRLKYAAILMVSAATGASVAVSGGIAFVGIIVPHLLRLLIGPDNRYLLPCSALLGACLLLLADALSRTIVAPAELPIGIVTAAAGGPFFLWILLRKRGILDL